MVLVDVPSLEQSGWQAAIAPVPLRDIPLTGRVLPPDNGVSLSGATLRIYSSADWLCGFFGLFDCLVSSWEVATGRIADDGSFTVMVPDFTNVPQSVQLRVGPRVRAGSRSKPIDRKLLGTTGCRQRATRWATCR